MDPAKSVPDRARLAVPASTSRSSRSSAKASSSASRTTVTNGRSSGIERRRQRLHEAADLGEPAAGQQGVEPGPQVAERSVVRVPADVDEALLDPARVGDENDEQAAVAERDELDVPDRGPGQRRVLDDGDLVGQLGEQPDGTVDDVVEVDGAVEQRGDGLLLRRRQRLDGAEPVDEQPVALVRGDPPRAGVRGWAMSPSSSRAAMSLRIVAGDTPSACRSTSAFDPTGSRVCT